MNSNMPDNRTSYSRLALATFILSLVMFAMSLAGNSTIGQTERTARVVQNRIEDRIEILEDYISKAIESDSDESVCLSGLPDDMVVYKYVNDSLKAWSNQFSVLNDDISNKMVFRRLTNLKNRIVSPLNEVTDEYTYMNLGPKWYLVKAVEGEGGCKIIAGMEIKNTLIDDIKRNDNGVNPHLKLSQMFLIFRQSLLSVLQRLKVRCLQSSSPWSLS